MSLFRLLFILLLSFVAVASMADESDKPIVKKSNARVCYEKSSPQYEDIKTYTAFDSLEDCQNSGGRLSPDSVAATPTPVAHAGKEKAEPTRLPQQL